MTGLTEDLARRMVRLDEAIQVAMHQSQWPQVLLLEEEREAACAERSRVLREQRAEQTRRSAVELARGWTRNGGT